MLMKSYFKHYLLRGRNFAWLLLGLSACLAIDANHFRLVADFEENERIYVVYIPQPYIEELISQLSQYEQIGVFVQSAQEIAKVSQSLEKAQARIENLRFSVAPKVDQWIRDSAPAILKNKKGQLQAVEFVSPKKVFDQNDRYIAQGLKLPLRSSQIKAVGGARESNGEGLVLATEEFYQNMDSVFDRDQIEADLKTNYGIKKVIWLEKGLLEDGIFEKGPIYENIHPLGSGGHVDEFCRFVNSHTVLLAEVAVADTSKHPLYKMNYERLEKNYQILKAQPEPKLKIIRAPAAELIFQQIRHPRDKKNYQIVLAASYLNFVIGNRVILAAKYYQEGMPLSVKAKDEAIYQILKTQFPKHEIVQLDPRRLNARGGGFHCVTFNLPTSKSKKKIKRG